MPPDEAKRIAALTALGFFTAMRTAKDPQSLVNCTRESILSAIATSVGTRLTVGTPNAPAYLVPQRPRASSPMELQFRINHRGWAILGYRAGFVIDPVPVSWDDDLTIRGATVQLEQDPDKVPQTKEELRGVVVYITELSSGHTFTSWVPVKVIATRAALSRGGNIWEQWPVEMAMGAAVRYAVARGKLPIDTAEVHEAMGAEYRADVIDATATSAGVQPAATAPPADIPAALRTEPASLPDHGDQGPSMGEQAAEANRRSEAARQPTKAVDPAPATEANEAPRLDRDAVKVQLNTLMAWLTENGAADQAAEGLAKHGLEPDPAGSWRGKYASTLAKAVLDLQSLRTEVETDLRVEAEERAAMHGDGDGARNLFA